MKSIVNHTNKIEPDRQCQSDEANLFREILPVPYRWVIMRVHLKESHQEY